MRPIQFKTERCELEWQEVPSELQAAIAWFDNVAEALGAPPTVVTCVGRTVRENDAAGGVKTSLHLTKRAVDVRNTHYDPAIRNALALVANLLKAKGFEVVTKVHGTGPHFHFGLKLGVAPKAIIR